MDIKCKKGSADYKVLTKYITILNKKYDNVNPWYVSAKVKKKAGREARHNNP